MDNKEQGNKIAKGNALMSIINHPSWYAIEDILKREYMDALKTLIDHEDEVARSKVTAIDMLYNRITNGLQMAEKASQELRKKIFKGG